MARPVVCFIHNRKVAGTAIRYYAERELVGRYHWFDAPNMPKHWYDCTPEDLLRCQLVAGHLSRPEFDAKIRRPKLYFYLAREPISRAVSLFEYIINGWDYQHPWRGELANKGLLWALRNHDGFREQALNDQCRLLCGSPNFEAAKESLASGNWIVDLHSNVDDAWAVACRKAGFPVQRLERVNENEAGYFERLATPEVIDLLRRETVEDATLLKHIEAMSVTGNDRSPTGWWRRLMRPLARRQPD